ncbi:MAG: hypothetical protein QF357_05350 [Dehalococcoidia bacterium]|nr:hypothetical protein [Dehalococcoidia bacterium]
MPKFASISLDSVANSSSSDPQPWGAKTAGAVNTLPTGSQVFWGVPFEFAGGGDAGSVNDLLVLAGEPGVEIAVGAAGSHLVFAHFCDERASTTVAGQSADYLNPVITAPGEHLVDYVIVFEDDSEHRQRIRRRFEINQVLSRMQSGFSSRQHQGLSSMSFRGPYPDNAWGRWQTGVMVGDPPDSGRTAARDDRGVGRTRRDRGRFTHWNYLILPGRSRACGSRLPGPLRSLSGRLRFSTGRKIRCATCRLKRSS